jgi:hypothetical protein
MCFSDCRRGLGRRLDLFTTITHDSWLHLIIAPALISTLHKSLQHTLSLFSLLIFTSRSLVTASNSGDSSTSAITLLLSDKYTTSLCTHLNSKLVRLITILHGPIENSSFIVTPITSVGPCLLRRLYSVTAANACLLRISCLAADVVFLFVSRS